MPLQHSVSCKWRRVRACQRRTRRSAPLALASRFGALFEPLLYVCIEPAAARTARRVAVQYTAHRARASPRFVGVLAVRERAGPAQALVAHIEVDNDDGERQPLDLSTVLVLRAARAG